MIIGAHSILYSKLPVADRASCATSSHCSPVRNMGWGMLTEVSLPGGGKLGIYQPRHARPKSMPVKRAGRRRKVPKRTCSKATAARRAGFTSAR